MPKAHFRPEEIVLLNTFLIEWKSAAQAPKAPAVKGKLTEKNQIVRRAVDALLEKFPDRKPDCVNPNEFTYTSEELPNLPDKFREWFKNKSRATDSAIPKAAVNTSKNVTTRMLFMTRYAEEIKEAQQTLRDEDSENGGRSAWNQATSLVNDRYNTENPDVYQELQRLAKDIRAGGGLDHVDQDPAVVRELLKRFPKTLHDAVQEWTRTTGVTLYALAVFEESPGSGIRTSQAVSDTIEDITGSREGQSIREELTDWIVNKIGAHMGVQAQDASPMVYPDQTQEQRPCLPHLDPTKEDYVLLRSWLRTYMNYLWAWQGGIGRVPWGKIAEDTNEHYYEKKRQPLSVTRLADPKKMNRPAVESWYSHILAGQLAKLDADEIFQFRCLNENALGEAAIYHHLCTTRHPESRLRWSPEEKLYALKLQVTLDQPGNGRRWMGLPPARLQQLYQPFDSDLRKHFDQISTKVNLADLAQLISELEFKGPVHAHDHSTGFLNPHFPIGLPNEMMEDLAQNSWLPVACFDETHADHSALAFSTLFDWIKTSPYFRHTPSGTWRGGPQGVRWILIIIARLTTTLTLLDMGFQVPEDLQRVHDASLHRRNWNLVLQMVAWLRQSVKQTIKILSSTFVERSIAWKEGVINEHHRSQSLAFRTSLTRSQSTVPSTCGIPTNPHELAAAFRELTISDPEMTNKGDGDSLQSATATVPTLLDRIGGRLTPSPETISISLLDSDEDSAKTASQDTHSNDGSEIDETEKTRMHGYIDRSLIRNPVVAPVPPTRLDMSTTAATSITQHPSHRHQPTIGSSYTIASSSNDASSHEIPSHVPEYNNGSTSEQEEDLPDDAPRPPKHVPLPKNVKGKGKQTTRRSKIHTKVTTVPGDSLQQAENSEQSTGRPKRVQILTEKAKYALDNP